MLNRPLASGTCLCGSISSAILVGGSRQNIAAKPRRTWGQNISSKSAVRLSNALRPRPTANRRKSKRRQPARIDPALQRAGDRRGHQLRRSRHQHDRADLQRVVLPDIGEKHRHQIDRAEQSDAEAEAEPAADRKRRHFQRGQFDHRLHRLQRSDGERRRGGRAEREQTEADGGEPAVVRGLLQADLQARQGHRHQRERHAVEMLQLVQAGPAPRQQERCRDRRDDARDDVDQEQPGPGIMVRDPAADHRPDRRRQHGHDTGDGAGDRMGARRKQQKDAREHRGDQRASGKALKDAEDDERRRNWC